MTQSPPMPFQQSAPTSYLYQSGGAAPAWRVDKLTYLNAGQGLVAPYACSFHNPHDYACGQFSSHQHCQLPGGFCRIHAAPTGADNHHFLTPAIFGSPNKYRMVDGTLYVAYRFKAPAQHLDHARFAYVRPAPGPWEIWCNRHPSHDDQLVWTVKTQLQRRERVAHLFSTADPGQLIDVQLALKPRYLTLYLDAEELVTFKHDFYESAFTVQFGTCQTHHDCPELATDYHEVFVNTMPYPQSGATFTEGPEDLAETDAAVVTFLQSATPDEPRLTQGDLICLPDNRLLAVYTCYHHSAAARLVARTSSDHGRTWSSPQTLATPDAGSASSIRAASLAIAANSDLLLAYNDQTPALAAGGVVLRRSADGGETWSERTIVSPPDDGYPYAANNCALIRLASGRLLIPVCRFGKIPMPLACFSDDDGVRWKSGEVPPDAGLTEQQRCYNLNTPAICELPDKRLLMTCSTTAGGQYFCWSNDQGAHWSKLTPSPLRGGSYPAIVRPIPRTNKILALWCYSPAQATPLVAATSGDGGLTWTNLKVVEQSPYHAYTYPAVLLDHDRVLMLYGAAPAYEAVARFAAWPAYQDLRLVVLPFEWFARR